MFQNRFLIALAIILLSIRYSKGESVKNAEGIRFIACSPFVEPFNGRQCFCSYSYGVQCNRTITKLKLTGIDVNLYTYSGIFLPSFFFTDVTTLEYIDLSKNKIIELEKGLFAKNDKLRWIIISDANLTALSDEQFANLWQLEELNLSGNRLLKLPANLLNGSINLKNLDFSHNRLQELSEWTFHTQHNLETLNFGSNKLTSISKDLFANTPNLIELNLSYNQLSHIPAGTFQKQSKLNILNLNNNQLRSLSNDTFVDLASLKELYLGGNLLQQLPETVFRNLHNLDKLGLDYNELTSLSELQFFNLTELRFLYLHENKLKTLPERIFQHQYNMELLDLNYNNLTTLREDLLINATELLKIVFDNNQLQNIPELIFRNQQKLQIIDLSHDQLRFLPSRTFANTNMTTFHLGSNKMQTFPDGIFENLKHARGILISENELNLLSKDLFANMMDLEYIHLENNQLLEIPEGILKNNNKLEFFDFHENNLSSLPENLFFNATKLYWINFSRNKLTAIPENMFNSQKDLMYLYMDGNRFTSIPDNLLKNTYNLVKLSIPDNFLETIPDKLFQNLHNLKILDLSNNKLTDLSSNLFVNTTALETIYLGSNRLLELPQGIFDNTTRLEILCLDKNFLRILPPDIFTFTTKLKILHLRNNKFKSIDSLRFINPHNVPIPDSERDSELLFGSNLIEHVDLNIILDLSQRFKSIDLWNNRIATLNYKSENIKPSSSPKELFLSQNPLHCDCQLLKNIDKLSGVIKFDVNDMKCNNIEKTTFVNQLRTDNLFCPISFENYESKCKILIREDDHTIKMNCSNSDLRDVQYLPNITTEMMKEHGALKCELDIQNNDLEHLPNLKLTQFECVQAINARNNSITSIQTENLSNNLTKLDISHNKLTTLSAEVIERLENLKNLRLVLEANKWECECDFHKFVLKNAERAGYSNIVCSDGELLQDKSSLCLWEIILVSTLIIFAISISVSAALYFKYKKKIKVWLYAHGVLSTLTNDNSYDESKKYDAFISYSHLDEKFVFDELLPELVNGPIKFKLCVDVQDWIIGESIPNQILSSVKQSRRTIVVLTKNFLQSNWGKMEIRTAHHCALKEGRIRLIIVIYGDIGDFNELDEDLQVYLRMNIYLKWGDRQFFDKLRYSLPHPPQKEPNIDDGVEYEMTTV